MSKGTEGEKFSRGVGPGKKETAQGHHDWLNIS